MNMVKSMVIVGGILWAFQGACWTPRPGLSWPGTAFLDPAKAGPKFCLGLGTEIADPSRKATWRLPRWALTCPGQEMREERHFECGHEAPS